MDKDKLNAFADKVFGDRAGAMTAGMGYIGSRPTSRLRSSAAAAFEKFAPKGVFGLDVMNRGQLAHRLTCY